MQLLFAVLIMLALIGISHVISRMIPPVPAPLIQIALGMLVSLSPKDGLHLELEPELFFVLFIAPLLYSDGKHTPRDELWRLRAPILLLAVGLVFVTVLVVGHGIHWMIPTIPLAAAFGFAAILSPTDPVAVGALAGRIHMPRKLLRLLEGEALMNDASGLVAFKFAIAAAVTGAFSLPAATLSFVVISVGGLIVGAAVAFLISWLRVALRRAGMEDVTMHMLLQIMTPFLLFLIAEELGMSGILAAVAGGIVHAVERDRAGLSMLRLNAVSNSFWSVMLYVLNGLVFVLLGLQIPDVSRVILQDPAYNNAMVACYALVILLMLMLLRLAWVYTFTRFGRWLGSPHAEGTRTSFRVLLITAISGVRGAVTLAGAFSIPLLLNNGQPFPERNLILFLAATVILLSLSAASLLLPLLAKRKGDSGEEEREKAERLARVRVMTAAIRAVRRERNEESDAAVASVVSDYSQWIREVNSRDKVRSFSPRMRTREQELRLLALAEERQCAGEMLRSGQLREEQARRFFALLDRIELLLTERFQLWKMMLRLFFRPLPALDSVSTKPLRLPSADQLDRLREVKLLTSQAAIRRLRGMRGQDKEQAAAIDNVIAHYNDAMDRLIRYTGVRSRDRRFAERRKELHWIALQAERDEVQALYEKGEMTRDMAGRLRALIREREAAMFEQDEIG